MRNGPLLEPVPVWVDAKADGRLVIRCGPLAVVSPDAVPGAGADGDDWVLPVTSEAVAWVDEHGSRVLPPALVAMGRPAGDPVIEPELVPRNLFGHPGVTAKDPLAGIIPESGERCWTCGAQPATSYNRWRYDHASRVRSEIRVELMCWPCHNARHCGGYEGQGYIHLARVNAWDLGYSFAVVNEEVRLWQADSRREPWWRNEGSKPRPPKASQNYRQRRW